MLGIKGLDQVIMSEVPLYSTIMLEGDTGVLKTTFAVECIKAELDMNPDASCLYFSFKDDVGFMRKKFNLPPFEKDKRLILFDYNMFLEEATGEVMPENPFDSLFKLINRIKEDSKNGLTFIVVDPINILLYRLKNRNARRSIYYLFSRLSDLHAKTVIIAEKEVGRDSVENSSCRFLADGIVELGMMDAQDEVIRYLEILKMRGVHHSLKRFQVSFRKGDLKILGPTYQT